MYSDKQSSTISGSLLSYGDENDVTIELYRTGEDVPTYSTSVLATTGQANFTLTDVESGVYTMKVSKKNHVTREYAVTVEDMDMVQDVEISLLGDATGDGKVNIKDWNRLKNHLVGLDVLTDYQLKCADVTCDEKVNIKDWNRLKNHLVGLDPLW